MVKISDNGLGWIQGSTPVVGQSHNTQTIIASFEVYKNTESKNSMVTKTNKETVMVL